MCNVRKIVTQIVFFSIFIENFSDGARILASVFTPSYSHQVAFRPLWKELDRRGHEITLITTDPMNDPNLNGIKEINVHMSYDIMDEYKHDELLSNPENPLEMKRIFMKCLHETSLAQLEHPEVQRIIQNKSEYFDLLMIEVAHPTHLGFVERWKVPLIGIVSLDASSRIHGIMGNTIHPAMNPDMLIPFSPPLSFMERLISFLGTLILHLDGEWNFFPTEDETIRKIFGSNSRPISELLEDIDMLFTNVNPILHQIRAVTPNTIMIGGGMHLASTKPLPSDLQEYLDNAMNGVIYFSLGSNVKSNLIRDDLRNVLLEAFADLTYKILWKFEESNLANKSNNVMIKKWLPQSDILRHPNVKLFITQCGLQSMEEAIMSHVPMIGLPFFGDQLINAVMMEKKGFGLSLDSGNFTKEMLRNAINEVLTNEKYKENVIEVASLIKDVEMSGLEKAVWWTEYVIRNRGAKLFKNPILKLPYYQYYLLDVIAFMSVLVFIVSFGSIKISLYLFHKFLANFGFNTGLTRTCISIKS